MSYYSNIKWYDNYTPYNDEVGDIYFATQSGMNEKTYVFINHNNLIERFTQLKDDEIFIIGETGFGTALNFLITMLVWSHHANKNAQLVYISFEKKPISPEDIKIILSNFPQLALFIEELLKQYYLITPATHRFSFSDNVYLNLVIGDINSTILEQDFKANAWFLDGFSPNKNPEMWNDNVIQNIARLSKLETTFATYTANSQVRKSLLQYGFDVHKTKGYNKREMLFGQFIANNPNTKRIRPAHWFDKYLNQNSENKIIIIGGGISGASTAYSLAKRGYHVTLYEKNTILASEASGNPQGILYGNFAGNYTPMLELSLSGYRYSYNLITKQLTPKEDYDHCGLIQLAYNEQTLKQHKQILSTNNLPENMCYLVTREQIKSIANQNIKCNQGLFFPYGLWVDPRILVNKLVSHPNIVVKLNTEIKDLIRKDAGHWQVITSNGYVDNAPNIILCNSYDLTKFTQFNKIYLRKIRGQISIIPGNNNLETIVCNNGYITPSNNNSYIIGASFKFKNIDSSIKYEEHVENLNNIKNILPQITMQININELDGRVSFRSSTTDYLPLVGPIANYDLFKILYKDLAKDSKYWIKTPCPYLTGLFVNVAHGAKGILTAPLCGEIIANYIDNTPLPISEKLRKALHPNRFWVKEIIRESF